MRFSACIELLFADQAETLPERIHLAAKAGLQAVEFWTWRQKPLDDIVAALENTGVELVAFACEPLGGLTNRKRHDTFKTALHDSLDVAERLGASRLILQAGNAIPDIARTDQHEAIVDVLTWAAPIAAEADVKLLLEPLNTRVDHPGYYLDSTSEGLEIIAKVNHPHVKLLYDMYHSAIMKEVPQEVIGSEIGLVDHVHVADAPGRNEPGTGEISWQRHLGWLQENGYRNYLGLEYFPSQPSEYTWRYLSSFI